MNLTEETAQKLITALESLDEKLYKLVYEGVDFGNSASQKIGGLSSAIDRLSDTLESRELD